MKRGHKVHNFGWMCENGKAVGEHDPVEFDAIAMKALYNL